MIACEQRVKQIIKDIPEHIETEIFVPPESCGQIIGKGGQNIREMCNISGIYILFLLVDLLSLFPLIFFYNFLCNILLYFLSGAKIQLEREADPKLNGLRRVQISGSKPQIEYARLLIEEKVELAKKLKARDELKGKQCIIY